MEHAFISFLRNRAPSNGLILGIGDDAAVLPPGDVPWLWTTDMLTEGVDFLLSETDPRRIGRKALAVNLSDIAAMGGIPVACLVSVALPRILPDEPGPTVPTLPRSTLELAELLYEGISPLAEKYGVALAGGDTNTWNGGLVISVTVLGRAAPRKILKRGGGKPGDVVFVTGKLGGSILKHQFDFEPRIREALFLNERFDIDAAMDISDGLSLDLHRMCTESGVGATLYENKIPIADDAVTLSKRSGKTPLEHALSDGEDFELLVAVPPDEAEKLRSCVPGHPVPTLRLYEIGELTADPGLRIRNEKGTHPLTPCGFEH